MTKLTLELSRLVAQMADGFFGMQVWGLGGFCWGFAGGCGISMPVGDVWRYSWLFSIRLMYEEGNVSDTIA